MKRQIRLSLTITLSVLLLLLSLPSMAQAQQRRRFKANSGAVILGEGQALRVTAAMGNSGNESIRVRFGWMKYMAAGCNSNEVCRHTVESQGITAPETLTDEALSFDVQGAGARVVVESDSPNVKVVFIVFDTSTQRIITIWQEALV
jgi:hypothetical protein